MLLSLLVRNQELRVEDKIYLKWMKKTTEENTLLQGFPLSQKELLLYSHKSLLISMH